MDPLLEMMEENLLDSEKQESIGRAFAAAEKIRAILTNLSESKDERKLGYIKVGTILTLAVIKKMQEGKTPLKYTEKDWSDVVDTVSYYAVELDPQEYSIFVFNLYAEYIDSSADAVEKLIPKDRFQKIKALAEELRLKEVQLREGRITETKYIEECLWIAFEAILKLLSSLTINIPNKEANEAAQAAVDFAFEYARFRLYDKERALLTEYIQHQQRVDDELQAKYDAYKEEVEAEAKKFLELKEQAFQPNFRERLISSVELARYVGVKEEQILDSVNKIDDFFN